MTTLNEIFVKLHETNNPYLRINNGTIWLSEDGKFIRWQNYGQSAVKCNLPKLEWLLKEIFEVKDINNISYREVVSAWSD